MNSKSVLCRFYRIKANTLNDMHLKVNGIGHVCLAILLRSSKPQKTFKVGISFKSPADKLDKTRGMKIAAGRLMSSKPGRNFNVTAKNAEAALSSALDKMLQKQRQIYRRGKAIKRHFVPDWLYSAIVEKGRSLTPVYESFVMDV